VPHFVLFILAIAIFGLSVFALRSLLDLREAFRFAELSRVASPLHWQATRAWLATVAAAPVLFAVPVLERGAWLAAAAVGGLGYWVAPQFLEAARRRAEHDLLDDLPVHLELIAISMQAGWTLPTALAACAHRAPEGALRRAWSRVILDIHAGTDPLEALRVLEQRVGVKLLTSVVNALRLAERSNADFVEVLRERARQSAAQRFARAERRARAAPLRLWAALVLAIAPCTFVVLAFPVARMLALALD